MIIKIKELTRYFLQCVVCLAFLTLVTLNVHAETIGYQGTHILTYKTMEELKVAFKKKTGIDMIVQGGGCADGISAILHRRYQMGGLCCPLDKNYLMKNQFVMHEVARDIKVVVVNRKNPLKNIGLDEIRRIHRGEIKNWKDLGWVDKPIAVIYRKHCLEMDEPVRRILMLDNKLKLLYKKAIVVRTDKELLDYVSVFPTAIGITSKVFAEEREVKMLSVDNHTPSSDNVSRGVYPLYAPLYIITLKKTDRATEMFIKFILSKEGQDIVKKHLSPVR